MEPRPPQPRSSRPFELPGSPETARIGERLYPTPGEPSPYVSVEGDGPGSSVASPLLPRRQRRQRGALRGIAVVVVALGLLAALGWVFRDAVRGIVVPPAPSPTAASLAIAPGTPAAADSAALPNALATVTPTVAAVASTATPEPEPAAEAPSLAADEAEPVSRDRDISAQTQPLLEFLPTQEQVPEGFILADEAERSREEVVTAIGGTEEANQLLEEWGWSGNAFRDFVPSEAALSPNGTTFLNFSVHRFADAESAANALVVFSDQVISAQGLEEVEAPAIGESARLLVGESEGVTLTVLYAQQGPIMYRIGGSALAGSGDPTADVLTVAGEIIAGQAGGG